jgi:hypothetical protein
MKYLEWNNCIGDYFFSELNRNKVVSLFTTEDDIFEVGVQSGTFEEDAAKQIIINDFKAAFRSGCPGATSVGQKDIVTQMIYECRYSKTFYNAKKDFFQCAGVTVRYPAYLIHVIGTLAALTHRNETSRYERILKYFNIPSSMFPNMDEKHNWNIVWQNLVWWANSYKSGLLGVLPEKSFSSLPYQYMNKPYVYLVLNKTELQNFYEYFEKNNIGPGRMVNDENVIQAFSEAGAIQGTRKKLLELLQNPKQNPSEDREILITLLKSIYESWNGISEKPVQGIRLKVNSQRLLLVLIPDPNGDFSVGYQFFIEEEIPSNVEFNKRRITVGPNNWSTQVFRNDGLQFYNRFVIASTESGFKAIFYPDPADIYVFVNGRRKNLNACHFIEVNNIERTGSQILLVSSEKATELIEWIRKNNGVEIEDRLNFSGWKIFEFDGFQESHISYTKLFLPASRFADISYGVKGNGLGAYVSEFPIIIKLEGAVGDEIIVSENNLEVELDKETQTFLIGQLQPGIYHFEILSNNVEGIRITNNGRIEIQSIKVQNFNQFYQLQEIDNCQFNEKDIFSKFDNLIRTGIVTLDSPPQFKRWARQETNFVNNPYEKMSVQLMEYIAFKGSVSKQTYDQNITPFYDRLRNEDGSFGEIEAIRKFTLQKLEEGCRIVTEFGENNSVSRIRPVKPFLSRVVNASNFECGISGMQPFTGKLFYLGGCYSADLLREIIDLSIQAAFLRKVQIKVYSEQSNNAFIPPSVFIHEKKECGFINQVSQSTNLSICNSYGLCPPIHNIVDEIEDLRQNPGKFHSFHSEERCRSFDLNDLRFFPTPIREPVNPSLSMYIISSYQYLFIIRKDDLEAEVNLRWGRYMFLYLMNKRTGVINFDQNKNTLAVPASLPFPPEVEKAFYLSTGRLPKVAKMGIYGPSLNLQDNGRHYLLYQGILKETATEIVRCLGQELKTTTINY